MNNTQEEILRLAATLTTWEELADVVFELKELRDRKYREHNLKRLRELGA